MGPYNAGAPGTSCTESDAWPFKMCSLKYVDDINNPPVYEEPSNEGWMAITVRERGGGRGGG